MLALPKPLCECLALGTSEDSIKPSLACQIAFRLFSLSFSALRSRLASCYCVNQPAQSFACNHVDFSSLWRWAQARILPEPLSLVKSVCAYFHFRCQPCVTASLAPAVSIRTHFRPLTNSTCVSVGTGHKRGFYQNLTCLSNPFVLIFTIVPNPAFTLGQSHPCQLAHTGLSPNTM